ncbi:DUF4279 domain-containing protein [Bacillus sp. RG28]|uniref:DUF4279 domain-containing protein n=1 Tax=Gottfriedia endophytica TaxID=2820819 RepID=A0A940SLP4_9BACI|nr:DUF4279 domain-containing protein [Gottfriedia endophytica]MBP0727354.1 DUF4279 domain-containing protein [Gottfriedia endophytica]
MEISGSFTFRIIDTNLDFNKIKQKIGLIPTKVIKKGQKIGKLANIDAPYDIWSYEIKIDNEEDPFIHLIDLLNNLLPYSKYIKEINQLYKEVSINCYLSSDYAQIGFELTSEMVILLEKLCLNLNFHILSFGGVED